MGKKISLRLFILVTLAMGLAVIAVGLLVRFTGCPTSSSQDAPMALVRPIAQRSPTPNYRLPLSVRPTKYQLSLKPYFPAPGISYQSDQNFTFDGNVTITLECYQQTNTITLHMYKIILRNDSIYLLDTSDQNLKIDLNRYTYDQKTQIVTFHLGSTFLQSGRTYQLYISYIGQLLANELAGFYPSSYLENGKLNWLLVTQFEPTDARRALPCFDEPSFKAIFEVIITHPTSTKALSNAVEIQTTSLGNGWSLTTFEPTERMSTYLLAFAVFAFQAKISYTKNGKTQFRVWSRPSMIDQTDYALYAGPKVLDYYASYFNLSFPLKKQDMLAIPDFGAGAMENWGLVTYRESALLNNDKISSSGNRQRVAVIIAHELAHQWFGDLVTMTWWDDIWLNEGFARYMEYVGGEYIADGAFHMDQQFIANLDSAMRTDQLSSSHPIVVNVSRPDEISAIFDDISYNKGGSILRMLNYTISEPVFQAGLQIYLKRHAYGNTVYSDLWNALSEAVKINGTITDWTGKPLDVSEYMNPWIMQMGYPILNVMRSYDQEQLASVSQERYILSGNYTKSRLKFQESPFNYTWYVPVWYQSESNTAIKFSWLVPNQTLSIPCPTHAQWLLVNPHVAGYYRVNYDEQNWRLLQNQLRRRNFEAINIKNRAQLLDDAFNLASGGYLSYDTALDTTLYLSNETSYIPWQAALTGINYLEDMLILSTDYQYLRNYLLALMMPTYVKTGWDDSLEPQDDVLSHYLRSASKSVQCRLGYPDCLDKAKRLFADFYKSCSANGAISSSCSRISPNLRRIVYCAGGEDGNVDWWNLLWDLHKTEQAAVEKDNLIYGLCCTRNPSLMTRLLDEAVNPNSTIVRRQDSRYVFTYISGNPVGRIFLWPYLIDNWRMISFIARTRGTTLGSIITSATRSFNTEFQAKMLEELYSQNRDLFGSSASSVEQQIEKVNANVEWMQKYRSDVVRWMIKHS